MRGRIVIGLILVLLGVGFLLEETGYWDFGSVLSTWWPLVFVIVGVVHLFSGRVFSGIIFTAIGAFLILGSLELIEGGFWRYVWPTLLVALGLTLLFSFGSRRGRQGSETGTHGGGPWQDQKTIEGGGRLNRFAMLGGDSTRVVGEFQGGEGTAFMGGVELDLRDATLPQDGATFSATAIMGGVEIVVPESWRVETQGPAILGGIDNKARSPTGGPLLTVRATAFMGGVEIKNKP